MPSFVATQENDQGRKPRNEQWNEESNLPPKQKQQHEQKQEQKQKQKRKLRYPFWFGGSASCFAASVTHPLDLIKVRLQTRALNGPKGMLNTFVHILGTDGIRGLYSGLSASLLRQLTYSTTRFGVYEQLKSQLSSSKSGKKHSGSNSSNSSNNQPSFPTLLLLASTSGLLGGIAGNPADVLNVRMQNDAGLPPPQRRNYANAIDGLIRITRDEGWRTLFRGVWPNSMRAVLMTASQLASYDTFKHALLRQTAMTDGTATHFVASMAAGFVATTICSPVDVIKTRVMSASGESAKLDLPKLLVTVYRAEGVGWMFKGWVPSFVRLGPHTVVTFLFLEQHKKMFRRWKGVPE